jgi:hypothetical protein
MIADGHEVGNQDLEVQGFKCFNEQQEGIAGSIRIY